MDSPYLWEDYDWVSSMSLTISKLIHVDDQPDRNWQNLSDKQRDFFRISRFMSILLNGGFQEYFSGGFGDEFKRTVEILNEIEAFHLKVALQSACELFIEGKPDLDYQVRGGN